jgi:hypothetical protein
LFRTPVRIAGHFIGDAHRGKIPRDWLPPPIRHFSGTSQGWRRSKSNIPPGETTTTMATFANTIQTHPAGAATFVQNCLTRIAFNRLIGSAGPSMQHPAPAAHNGMGSQHLHGSSRVVDAEHSTEQADSLTSKHLQAVQFGATRAPAAERAGSSTQPPALPTNLLPVPPVPLTPEQYLDLFMQAYHDGPVDSRAVAAQRKG